jgi:hypothetical protein
MLQKDEDSRFSLIELDNELKRMHLNSDNIFEGIIYKKCLYDIKLFKFYI